MIPHHCITKHDPEAGKYGDCVRACIASLFDVPVCDDVPHFYHDNDSEAGLARLTDWLALRGFTPFFLHYDPDATLDDILTITQQNNPTSYYLLFGATSGGDHVVVCRGGQVMHDPSWISGPMVGPASNGCWSIMLVVRA